jgi:glycosyltransferase involved in cell wall biosynthesis
VERSHGEQLKVRAGILAYGLDRPAAGIGRYAIELVKALRRHQPDIELVLLKPFDGPVAGLGDGSEVRLRGTRLLPAMMALGPVEIAIAARRHRLDVVHDPSGISPFLVPNWLGRFGRVVTIHDMVPFIYPETHLWLTNFLFRRYIPRTLRFVDRVVTVSDASKRDIERFLPIAPDRVTRIHCGVSEQFRPQVPDRIVSVLDRYGVARPYILVVGVLAARKNLEAAFEAFARLKAAGLPHRLVVVGRKAWKAEGIFQRLEALGLGEEVVLTGYVEDTDLPALYAGADCFIFPSLYEGFGLPLLEAMACGVPVVASNASSLPEVAGDAGLLVDPRDVDGFASAMHRVVAEPGLANDLRERGFARARQFTWERVAAAHAAIYHDVAAFRR